jgi:ATP-dependent RNA helicase DHX57
MLIFGALLTCLDPVLTIASAMAHGRPVFMSPSPDARDEVETARRELLMPAVSARSDHIALVAAFNTWARLLAKGGSGSGAVCHGGYCMLG